MTFSERIIAEKQDAFEIGLRIGRQQMIDFLQLALQKKGFGEKRIWELLMEVQALNDEFRPAFDVKHPECDPCRDRLDRAIAQNCGKEHPLIPFAERYEDLKQVVYGRKKQ
jgi:hypothetical protein